MNSSAERANVGQDVIKLTDEEAAKFQLAVQRRQAIMEAGETMARNFATQMDEAMAGLQQAYLDVAAQYNLDLKTHRYEYDAATKTMVLTQVALHGGLR